MCSPFTSVFQCDVCLFPFQNISDFAKRIDSGNITLSDKDMKRIEFALRVEFHQDEMESMVLDTIARCAEEYQTEKYYFAKARDSRHPDSKICYNRDSRV